MYIVLLCITIGFCVWLYRLRLLQSKVLKNFVTALALFCSDEELLDKAFPNFSEKRRYLEIMLLTHSIIETALIINPHQCRFQAFTDRNMKASVSTLTATSTNQHINEIIEQLLDHILRCVSPEGNLVKRNAYFTVFSIFIKKINII